MLSATSFASVASCLTQLPATEQCLVADQSCSQIQALVVGAQLKALDGAQNRDPLKGIGEGLRQQQEAGLPIRTLHLVAHGRPGAFRIGGTWIDSEALKAHATELAHWGVETIALWSCHVGADANFVALLAELSGAQVLASADWLGRDGDGNERLQLGAWSLADVTDASAWPASFRLASVPYDEISTGALSQRLSSQLDDLLLLDVRPLASSAADAIEGAVRIPWPTIESGAALDQVRSLAAGKDVHVICQSGGWSAASSQFLEDQGIEVTNVAGGMNAWSSMQSLVETNVLASGVPDDLDPEGVRIALEGGKRWGASGSGCRCRAGSTTAWMPLRSKPRVL